jgi:hypothetical protein
VPRPEARFAIRNGKRLEDTVTKQQSPIQAGYTINRLAIDQYRKS